MGVCAYVYVCVCVLGVQERFGSMVKCDTRGSYGGFSCQIVYNLIFLCRFSKRSQSGREQQARFHPIGVMCMIGSYGFPFAALQTLLKLGENIWITLEVSEFHCCPQMGDVFHLREAPYQVLRHQNVFNQF